MNHAPEHNLEQPAKRKNTGWAILVALIGSLVFYVIYRMLFTFIVALYAKYDPGFASGTGALILLVFGANARGFLSGAVVARKLFPRASGQGMFYGLASLLVAMGIFSILAEMTRYDSSWVVAIITVLVIVVTIFAIRFVLLNDE